MDAQGRQIGILKLVVNGQAVPLSSFQMTPAQQTSILSAANCEIRFDALTRHLYARDASHYHVEPVAVAFPRGAKQASSVIHAAAEAGLAVIPRGAGTGLIGGALGDGVVVDFSRYNRGLADFNADRRTIRVGSGVVLDQLNNFLFQHGLWFGPDVATSSRATLGGMIANNSSGSHAPYYGLTSDHVIGLEVVMADGSVAKTGPDRDELQKQRETIENLVFLHGLEISERRPPGLVKRWPAYAVERCLKGELNLNNILCGSEGTLAAITSAELQLVPLPEAKGLALLFLIPCPTRCRRPCSCLICIRQPSNTWTVRCWTRRGVNSSSSARAICCNWTRSPVSPFSRWNSLTTFATNSPECCRSD